MVHHPTQASLSVKVNGMYTNTFHLNAVAYWLFQPLLSTCQHDHNYSVKNWASNNIHYFVHCSISLDWGESYFYHTMLNISIIIIVFLINCFMDIIDECRTICLAVKILFHFSTKFNCTIPQLL